MQETLSGCVIWACRIVLHGTTLDIRREGASLLLQLLLLLPFPTVLCTRFVVCAVDSLAASGEDSLALLGLQIASCAMSVAGAVCLLQQPPLPEALGEALRLHLAVAAERAASVSKRFLREQSTPPQVKSQALKTLAVAAGFVTRACWSPPCCFVFLLSVGRPYQKRAWFVAACFLAVRRSGGLRERWCSRSECVQTHQLGQAPKCQCRCSPA